MTALLLKWLPRILLGLLGLLILFWIYFRFFAAFGPSSKEVAARLAQAPFPVTARTYLHGTDTMHYMQGGRPDGPALVFVHGSPGNWEAWEAYLRDSVLCQYARIYAIDRLGYGGSMPGTPVPSLGLHAASLRPLVDSLHAQGRVILIGHSMGGPIVARAAMDFPGLLDGILILAGSADPGQEKVMGIQRFIQHRATRWLIPPDLDMSNRELMPHAEELEGMRPRWDSIPIPVTILHGQKDQLVPWQNAEYMARLMPSNPPRLILLPEENHFIPWTRTDTVRAELIRMLEALR